MGHSLCGEGYAWELNPESLAGSQGRFLLGLLNPGVWRLISRAHFDAVVLYTGYVCATFWIALAAAKWNHIPVLFGTDAHELAPRDSKKWKVWLKQLLWPRLFRLANVVMAPSSGTVALMQSLGIPSDRIVMSPYCVDNQWWMDQSAKVDRSAVRARWNKCRRTSSWSSFVQSSKNGSVLTISCGRSRKLRISTPTWYLRVMGRSGPL